MSTFQLAMSGPANRHDAVGTGGALALALGAYLPSMYYVGDRTIESGFVLSFHGGAMRSSKVKRERIGLLPSRYIFFLRLMQIQRTFVWNHPRLSGLKSINTSGSLDYGHTCTHHEFPA